MCGIWGLCGEPGRARVAMLDRLAHRGPDASGVWHSPDDNVTLGHRRLAIIDLSPAGNQPMLRDNGRLVVAFNGEIYNYLELRRELERLGERFRTSSDTEVLLAAYDQWGPSCVTRFNGMFAFALYDTGGGKRSPSVFLARDRVGKKPLYYRYTGRRLEFASELRACLPSAPRIDPWGLALYLGLGYLPHDVSLVSGVSKLPPAHWAHFDLTSGSLTIERYWNLPPCPSSSTSFSEADLLEQLEQLLLDSSRIRQISDVPVGVFLSGGVDSSLIVAATARTSTTPIRTFTVAFSGHRQYDEQSFANEVSVHFGTKHTVLEAPDLSPATLDDWYQHIDEPIADTSILPTFWISRLTRQHVTVAVGGDGGDELFGGYPRYREAHERHKALGMIPDLVFKAAGALAGCLPAGCRGRTQLVSWRHGLTNARASWTPYFDETLRRRFFQGVLCGPISEEYQRQFLAQAGDELYRESALDFALYLPDDIMAKVDRASMACSLEVRAPWLDYRLVEFAFGRVPSTFKIRNHQTRWLQRQLARRLLPASLDLNRKQGFSLPFDDLLRNPGQNMREVFTHHLEPLRPILHPQAMAHLWSGLRLGRANGARLFALSALGASIRNLRLTFS